MSGIHSLLRRTDSIWSGDSNIIYLIWRLWKLCSSRRV